jgi:hypothetical protein
VNPAHQRTVLLTTCEANPRSYEALLALPGVGPKAVRALVDDHSIAWLSDAVARARIGRSDRLDALRQLHAFASATPTAPELTPALTISPESTDGIAAETGSTH